MNSNKQITLSPEETLSELTSILARGYIRYRQNLKVPDKSNDYSTSHTNSNKNNMLTKNNLTIRPTRAFVQTTVNKGRKRNSPREEQRTLQ